MAGTPEPRRRVRSEAGAKNMANTHMLRLRISPTQYQRLKDNAHTAGSISIANYLRYLLLDKEIRLETSINAIGKYAELIPEIHKARSEERRVGKECRL